MSTSLQDSLAAFKTRKKLPLWVKRLDLPTLTTPDGPLSEAERTKLLLAVREDQPLPPIDLPEGPQLANALIRGWGLHGKHNPAHAWILRTAVWGDNQTADALVAKVTLLERQPTARQEVLSALVRMGRADRVVPFALCGDEDLEQTARATLEPAARQAGSTVDEMLIQNVDWRAEVGALTKPKKLPPWLKARELSLSTPEGPLDQALLNGVLRAAIGGGLKPLAPAIRADTTAASRDALCVALLDRWEDKGFHGRFKWIRGAIEAFGGDATALALEERVVAWPNQSDTGRKRAIDMLSVFRHIGTNTALLVLLSLRQKVVAPSLIQAAQAQLKVAARDRKLGLGELKDRITPTCGLDRTGSRTFDYGPRQFALVVDAQLRPRLRHPIGERLDTLPDATSQDDPTAVERAQAAWGVLDATLQEVMEVQAHRLEEDMVQNRRWSVQAWRRWIFEHPLMVHFARRLVWAAYDGDRLVTSFRANEELELVDADDEPIELPHNARIGVPHPLHLDDEARAAWLEQLEDYEVVQPFAQLGRDTWRTDSPAAKTLTRFKATAFSSGQLRDTLVLADWEREPGLFRGWYEKAFPDNLTARAILSPGVYAGGATYSTKDQTVPEVQFRKGSARQALGKVPADILSEVVRDLQQAADAS